MTDAPGHLDLDALADVLAGERDDAHLRSCVPCTDRLAELAAADASVTRALAALPPPGLPDGLSARLSQALQAERRREVTSLRSRRRRAPGWLPAAAASLVLVLAGAVGVSQLDLSGGGSDSTADTSGGGGQAAAPAAPESAGSESAGSESAGSDAAMSLAQPGEVTDWADEASRTAALPRLLQRAADAPGSARAAPSGDAALERLRDPAQLTACLASLPGGGDDVLAVDHGRYAGIPAVAVVRPSTPGSVEVSVVGSRCSAADPDVLARLVLLRP